MRGIERDSRTDKPANLRRIFRKKLRNPVRYTGRFPFSAAFLAAFMVLMGGCAGDPSAGATAEAINATLGTEVANRRSTATYDADRLFVTQSALETSAALASRRQGQIISTLEELGLPRPDISVITPAALPTRISDSFVTPTLQPMDIASGGITRPAPTVDPLFSPIPPTETPGPPTSTPDPNAPRVENMVMSNGVGDDDCAVGVTDAFTTGSSEIYIVATAYNVARGSTIASRWLRDGTELTRFEFTPDFDINGACIWFFADQSDFAFTAGAYSVELDINNANVARTAFSVQ